MSTWDNFVSCDLPKAGIHIQRRGQEEILAQILKEKQMKQSK